MKTSGPPRQMISDVQREKQRLRRFFRRYRAGLPPTRHQELSRRITDRLDDLPVLRDARVIHTFWPAADYREPDFRPLIRRWLEQDKTVVMPVDAGTHPPTLRHVRFTGEAGLVQNQWGVHEPSQGEYVPPDEIEVVIAPALGAGRNGYRIGYGKGYYDSFLSSVVAVVVAPLFHACVMPSVPSEPHDVPVSMIVTERETIETPAFATSEHHGRRGQTSA